MNARVELPPAREVCPTTTRRLLAAGALMVDVRELGEVARVAFDVPGVLLMPMSELEQRFTELPRDRDLVLVCQVGERSLKATYFLMYHCYTRVANMEGGLLKWARKGFPIMGANTANPAAVGGGCGTTAAASSCCDTTPGATAPADGCCSPSPASSGKCC